MPDTLLIQDNGIPKSILSQITATEENVMTGKTFLTSEGLISNGSLTRLSGGGTCLSVAFGDAPDRGSMFRVRESFDPEYMSSYNRFAKACNIRFRVWFGHAVYLNTVKIQVGSLVLFNQQWGGGYRTIDKNLSVNAGDTISVIGPEANPQTGSVYLWVVTLQ